MEYLQNRPFDAIAVGDEAALARAFDPENREHSAASVESAGASVTDPTWAIALIHELIESQLPGPGAVWMAERWRVHAPFRGGQTYTVRAVVRAKDAATRHVHIVCTCVDSHGALALDAEVELRASEESVRRPRIAPSDASLHAHGVRYRALLEAARRYAPLRTAVVHPCDALSLGGALDAAQERLIVPILIGPSAKIRAAAEAANRTLEGIEIVDTPHSHAAAATAAQLARNGKVQALMKGALHTDELMLAVLDAAAGLRTERRMSHVFALDVPTYAKPLFVTDAVVNIAPTLDEKRDIAQNAIDLVRALGIDRPKVAILSAVETVNSNVLSTIDAAALCKMADRGQITGGVLDGPLAFDNAVSKRSADIKHLASPVAGDADILLVPQIESGNMIAKQLIYLAGAEAAGIVLGARVPIMLTSRSDSLLSRLASCALALLFANRNAVQPS